MKYKETVIECSYEECGRTIRVREDDVVEPGDDPIVQSMEAEGWRTLRWMSLGRGRASEREYCSEHWALLLPAIPEKIREYVAPEVQAAD